MTTGNASVRRLVRRRSHANGRLARRRFRPYVAVSWLGGAQMGVVLVVFLVQVIGTLGLGSVLGLFVPDGWLEKPRAAAAQA